MKKCLLLLLFFIHWNLSYSQTCNTTLVYDNVEAYTWVGLWNSLFNAGYYNNVSVSPNISAALIGVGSGTSAVEQSTYLLPNIIVNPNFQHIFRFRLGSYRITSTSTTSGVDNTDYVDVRLSTNSGTTYVSEMRITGFSNAFWNYNTNATASKTANGILQTFSPTAGGNRTNTGDGYSIIELRVPAGVSNIAINLLCRANSAGEEWWLDNMELIRVVPRPNNPIVTIPNAIDTTICYGEFINLVASSNTGTLEWYEQASGGTAIGTGNSFTTSSLTQNTSYWVQSNNSGCLSNRTQRNIIIDNCILPLELLNFYGEQRLNVVDLFWETANEVNTDYFVVEKSYDGIIWSEIGNIKSAGNYLYNLAYIFTDESPKNGNNYYRLKQYDIDGNYQIYHTICVEIKKNIDVIVYHSNNTLWLKEVQDYFKYKLISLNGVIIFEGHIISNNYSFETSFIPNGLYILLLMKSDNSFESIKIYIKN
jgi:hypothetical protein